MKSHIPNKTRLAAALAVLMVPALACAQGDISSKQAAPNPASAATDVTNDPYGMQTTQQTRDAYREGMIWATYAANPALNAYHLFVDVHGDRAILTGRVESTVDKLLAERIALRAQGVARVDNRIEVDPLLIVTMYKVLPASSPQADSDNGQVSKATNTDRDGPSFARYVADATLAAMVNSRLLWNPETDGTDITVDALAGVVTLTGRADTLAAKNTATRLAQSTRGTVQVDNRLIVESKGQVTQALAPDGDQAMSDTWVAAKVNSSLMWSAGVDAGDIDVNAKDGVVTLTGVADSAAARRQAIDMAQSVRGVKRVDASELRIEVAGEVSQR